MPPSGNRLFVGNIPFELSEAELRSELDALAIKPSFVRVVTDRDTGRGKGFAFVEFNTNGEAAGAMAALTGHCIGARPLRIELAEPRPERSKGGGGGGGARNGGGSPRHHETHAEAWGENEGRGRKPRR